MADSKICDKCGYELFSSANPLLCEQCAEEFFTAVKDYIDENPDNTLDKVSEKTGVQKKYLKKWVREGRIQYSSPEEDERRKKLANLKKDYEKLLEKRDTETSDKTKNQGYHTRN